MAPLSKLEKFINLVGGEDKLPKKTYNPALTDEELAARAPDSTISPHGPVDDHSLDIFHGEPYNNTDLQLVEEAEGRFGELETKDDFRSQQPQPWCTVPLRPLPVKAANNASESQKTSQPVSPKIDLDGSFELDPRTGDPAPLGINFSPLLGIIRFPYKFVSKVYMQPIASQFFDQEKVWNRGWDLYFVNLAEIGKPVIFVPEYQLQSLITEIQTAFPDAKVEITEELRDRGLVTEFETHPDLRPRWLGHSQSKSHYNFYTGEVPLSPDPSDSMDPNDRSVEAFKAKIEAANDLGKAKNKAAKTEKIHGMIVKRQQMGQMMKRAQRYLGLQAKVEAYKGAPAGGNFMPDLSVPSISPIDVSKPAPHAFDEDAVIIAIDVESFERAHHLITEVGVATLDTRDLLDVPPGRVGEEWHKHIRGRHFRIIEHKHLNNTDFVRGCADRFEFGTSEFVSLANMPHFLASCFNEPFSKVPDVQDFPALGDSVGPETPKRKIILLGHDIDQDINYLRKLGFSPLNRGNLLEVLDTAHMYRAYTREPNAKSLGGILYDFDLTGWHLHNAGNDAVYTVQAMLAMCVKDASERGDSEVEKQREAAIQAKEAAAIEHAKERVKEDTAGWESSGNDDGGVPVPPKEPVPDQMEYNTRGGIGGRGTAGRGRGGRGRGALRGSLFTSGGRMLDI